MPSGGRARGADARGLAGGPAMAAVGCWSGAMRGGDRSRRGRRGVLAASCGSASGEPGALPVPTFPATADGRGVRRPGRRDGPGPAARRLHAAARRQRPGRPVRAAARLGRRPHHDRHPGPVRRPHRAADLRVHAHRRGAGTTCSTSTSAPTPTRTPPPSSGGPTPRVEDGPHRDVALGSADGVLVERPTDAVLAGRERCRDARPSCCPSRSGSATSRPPTRWSTSPCGCCRRCRSGRPPRVAARRAHAAPTTAPPRRGPCWRRTAIRRRRRR